MIGRDAAHFTVAAGGQGTLSLCVRFRQHKGQLGGGDAFAVHISRRFADAHRAAPTYSELHLHLTSTLMFISHDIMAAQEITS